MASVVESSSQGSNPEQQQQQGTQRGISRHKLVQRLLATSANLPAFVHDLLYTQATVVVGTEAAAFLVERGAEGTFSLKPIAHIREDDSSPEARAVAIAAFQEIVTPCVQQGKDGAIEVGASADQSEPQFCLVTLLRAEADVVAATAVITRCRDLERAHQRLMSMQLVAGYFDLFTLRRTSEQARQVAQSHQHVLQLATAVATAEGFVGAARGLCNELAARTGASRVSIGWTKGGREGAGDGRVQVKAISHTEEFDRRQELIVQLERAMEECYDQGEIVQWDQEGASTENVTREAAALARAQGAGTVISLPLRRQAEVEGIVTLEFGVGTKLGPQAAQGLAVAVDLLAPQLYDRHANDRWLITKAGVSLRETAKMAFGAKHTAAKMLILLVIGLLVAGFLYKPMYHVNAGFQFVPVQRNLVAAPYEGFIKDVLVLPGNRVVAGQPLVVLRTTELELDLARARSESRKYELEAQRMLNDRSEGRARVAEANYALAQRDAALKQAEFLQFKIDNSTVRSPMDGVVLQGDLEHKRGAPVKQGDTLMEVGQPENLRVELKVAERDVQWIRDSKTGRLATTSMPGEKKRFVVDRIVPLGTSEQGENLFTVYGTMTESSPQWMAGQQGEANIEVGKRPIIWHYTHRFLEWVELQWWKWVPFA